MYATNEFGDIIYYGNSYEDGLKRLAEVNSVTDLKVDDARSADTRYYNLMGIPFDTKPTVPGIYIHQGRKVVAK